jgi:hypothetical protein
MFVCMHTVSISDDLFKLHIVCHVFLGVATTTRLASIPCFMEVPSGCKTPPAAYD